MTMTSLAQQLNAAVARHQAGDLEAARGIYQDILKEHPDQADALHLLGVLRDQQGAHAEAVELISRAIALSPGEASFHGNLGTALLAMQRDADAEAAYRQAIRLDPAYAEGHYNLANLLRRRGETAGARRHFETALALQPGYAQARNNLAMLLWEDLGDNAAAEGQYRLLLQAAPGWATGRMNYGLFRLSQGQFAEGWREYEWRWRSETYNERDWGLGLPRWDGRPLQGESLLVWGEQGPGDQILHGTMLADIARLSGGRLFAAVDERLVPLFRRSLSGSGITVVPRGTTVPAGMQCPFGSLGNFVRCRREDFTRRQGGYLRADDGMRQSFLSSYRDLAGGRRLVGLSWWSANRSIGEYKSIPWRMLLPLLRRPDVLWICLQYGEAAEEVEAMRREGVAIHVDRSVDGLASLDAFAAQVSALDAVLTVSNTTVHMAGALGVPTALLLARGRGRLWYWPEQGAETLWYDSVSALHQPSPGDWSGLVEPAGRFLDRKYG